MSEGASLGRKKRSITQEMKVVEPLPGRLLEYPLTPKRQVGAVCIEPRFEQGQLPWMYL